MNQAKEKIVERKKTRQTLLNELRRPQSSEKQFQTLVEQMNEGLLYVTNDDVIVFANQQFCDLVGYPSEELLGKTASLLLFDKEEQRFIQAKHQLRQQGVSDQYEIQLRKKSGETIWVHISGAPLYDSNNHVIGSVGLMVDITDRKRATDALRESERRLRESLALQHRLLASLPTISFITTDLHAIVTSVSPGTEQIFGYRAEEMIGRHVGILHLPEDVAKFLEIIKAQVEGRIGYNGEITMVRKNGERFPAQFITTPILDEEGKVIALLGVSHDITERKRAEEVLATRVHQQAVVANLGRLALASTDIQRLFDQAVAMVATALGVEYCKVLELLPDGNALKLVAGVGWKEGSVGQATVDAGHSSQAGFTLLSKEPVIVKDLRTETRFSGPPLLHDHGVVSGISVAIGNLEKPFGVMGAHTIRQRVFSQDDVHFFQSVANVLAEAIQRKRVEDQLRESQERFSKSFRSSSVALAITSLEDGCYVEVNDAFVRLFGYSQEEAVGRTTVELNIWENLSDRDRMVKALKRDGYVRDLEVTIRTKSGGSRQILGSAELITIQGKPHMVGIAYDITERRKMEEKFKGLLESAPDAMVIVDGEGKICIINSQMEKLFGYRREELYGQTIELLIPERLRSQHQDHHAGYFQNPQTRPMGAVLELHAIRKDGSEFPVHISLSPQNAEEGTLVTAVIRDITERKESEQRLSRSREQLRALARRLQAVREEERTRLSREIHDELGQILTATKMNLVLLRGSLENPRSNISADSVREEIISAIELLDRSLESVHSIASQLRPEVLDQLGLSAAVHWQTQEFQHLTKIHCRLHENLNYADVSREQSTATFRIFQETLTNIMRHSQATEVHIRLQKENGTLVLEVEDNGKGITEDEIKNVSSLGIVGMQERALLVGGEVTIRGTPQQGTTVRLRIPLER